MLGTSLLFVQKLLTFGKSRRVRKALRGWSININAEQKHINTKLLLNIIA
jgi:hypothetical protein